MSEPFHIVERESFRVAGYCIHTTNKRKTESNTPAMGGASNTGTAEGIDVPYESGALWSVWYQCL